jgi:NADH-quinone oxidoreductase subunit L
MPTASVGMPPGESEQEIRMTRIDFLIVLIPALPLLAALATALLGKRVLSSASHLPALLATATAFVLSLVLLFDVRREATALAPTEQQATAAPAQGAKVPTAGYEHVVSLWTWANIADAYQGLDVKLLRAGGQTTGELIGAPGTGGFNFTIDVALRADPLTSIMLATVTFISMLVVIYSIGYMHGDPGYWRFFTYVSLFVFSMTMLVSASNFLLLYVFWEAVGVCSYLLIGFWYQKRAAAAAGMKAFLVNRVGDFGFALGVFLIWVTYGTLNFHDVLETSDVAGPAKVAVTGVLGSTRLLAPASEAYVGGAIGLTIALLLFIGACGKSAQFPLHVWLPDAMEGPTPVSALIHAATMVTAGVYMVARCTPLFLAAPEASHVVAAIGGFTALLAALIAVTQTDLKRVLAYSTISQLGYMFLGLGTASLAGITAGMFHLFTHTFFKALLFLGAGSVMHAMGGVIDMRSFGGLRRKLPITHWTFFIGSLALAGVVPLSGFWSKDEVLAAVLDKAIAAGDTSASDAAAAGIATLYRTLYWGALFTAGLTAFYTFRAFFWTFYGEERIPPEAGHHAHESPPSMTGPLAVLAVLSAFVGWWFAMTHGFAQLLNLTPSLAYGPLQPEHAPHGGHLTVAAVSTLIACGGILLAGYMYCGDRSEARTLARLLAPAYRLSYGKFYIDAIYNALVVLPLRGLAVVSYWIDRYVIDAIVNLCGYVPLMFGSLLRPLQNGVVPFYALVMVLGMLVLLVGSLLSWPVE